MFSPGNTNRSGLSSGVTRRRPLPVAHLITTVVCTVVFAVVASSCSTSIPIEDRTATSSNEADNTLDAETETDSPINADDKPDSVEPGAEDDHSTVTAPTDPIAWNPCGGGLECGTVVAPLDYDDPAAGEISLALVRRPATGEAEGSIFVNPGGPGASGIETVRSGFQFDESTASRFHTVGFDPRGIGQSSPLVCSVDRSSDAMVELSPDSAAETAALNADAEAIAAQCSQLDGAILPHLTTTNVARDINVMRQAVGDEVLNFYGFSYGTLLAVRYAQLFPDSVGRVVLDGVVAPDQLLTGLLDQQANAFESGFRQLEDRCSSAGPCPDGGLQAGFDRLYQQLEQSGPVGGIGSTELVMASLLPIYNTNFWPGYRDALLAAEEGDGSGLKELSGFFTTAVSFTGYAAHACADGGHEGGLDTWDRFADGLMETYPRFGAVIANELRTCAFWPQPDPDPTLSGTSILDVATIPNVEVLIIGVTSDAATPFANAEALAGHIPRSHLVVVEGQRHTAYSGSQCVRDLVSEYFAAGLDQPGQSNCSID